MAAPCYPCTCCLFSSPGQICFVQHLSSSRGCRTFLAQRKTPSLELQTRKMVRVCLMSMCLVLRRMRLRMSSGCGSFPYCAKNDRHLLTHEEKMDGKTWLRKSPWMGWCGTVRRLSFRETWDGAAQDASSTELLLSPCLGLDGRNFMYNLLCKMTAWQL